MYKTVVIDSLQKFIEEIENYPSDKFFYRGEQEKFKALTSSALRPYLNGWNKTSEYPFISMIHEFYRETALKLTIMQKMDFPAFAQHFGIPTNLLDITSAPLISLFFACEHAQKKGYIYLFDNDYIDITELIHSNGQKNILDDVLLETPSGIIEFINLFTDYSEKFPEKFNAHFEKLIDSYMDIFGNMSIFSASESFTDLEIELRKPYLQIDLFSVANLVSSIDKTIPSEELKGCDIKIIAFMCLAKLFFILAKATGTPIPDFDFFPNFIYQPIMPFERGRSQNGLFFYQAYISYLNPERDTRYLLKQKIRTEPVSFEIHNKEKIMKSLDNIGINRKTIFRDFDSIAAYIKEKHEIL